jgi:hypothetical protein
MTRWYVMLAWKGASLTYLVLCLERLCAWRDFVLGETVLGETLFVLGETLFVLGETLFVL